MFIATLFTIAKCWKQRKCPSVNEWIKKLWYIHTMKYYTAERKKELLPFVTEWKELENIMLNEISPSGKDKYHMISLIKAQIWTTVWELTVRVEGGMGGRGQWGKIGTTAIDKNKK